MMLSRAALWALLLISSSAWAQLEDDLEPLIPSGHSAPKHRTPKKSKPKFVPVVPAPLAPAPSSAMLVLKLPNLSGMRLFVDGQERSLENGKMELSAGEHVVNVRRLGYADFVRRAKFPPGRTELTVSMDPVAGAVLVKLSPMDAQLSVDGHLAQPGKDGLLLLTSGSHQLLAKRSGFSARSTKLSVEAGKDYAVELALLPEVAPEPRAESDRPVVRPLSPARAEEPVPISPITKDVSAPPPWYTHWYVWAGAGAVVASVATGVILASHGSAGLSPEKVCNGQCSAVMNGP